MFVFVIKFDSRFPGETIICEIICNSEHVYTLNVLKLYSSDIMLCAQANCCCKFHLCNDSDTPDTLS